jgi:hypothetical protein
MQMPYPGNPAARELHLRAYPQLEKDQKIRLAKEGVVKELKICLANGNLNIARNRVGAPESPKREAILENIFDINAHGDRTLKNQFLRSSIF